MKIDEKIRDKILHTILTERRWKYCHYYQATLKQNNKYLTNAEILPPNKNQIIEQAIST